MNEEKRQWSMEYNSSLKEEQRRVTMNGPLQTATVSNQEMLTYMPANQAQQEQIQQVQPQQLQAQSVGVDGLEQNGEDDDDMVRFSADLESLLNYPSGNSDCGSARVSPKYFNHGGEGDTPFPVGVRYNPTTCPTNSKISPTQGIGNPVSTTNMNRTSISSEKQFHAQAVPVKPPHDVGGNSGNVLPSPVASAHPQQQHLQQTTLQPLPQYGGQIQQTMIYKKYSPQLQSQPSPPQAMAQSWMVQAQGTYTPVLPPPSNMRLTANLPPVPSFQSNYGNQPRQEQQQVSLPFPAISSKFSFPATGTNISASSSVSPPVVSSNPSVKRTRNKRGGKRRKDASSVCPSTTTTSSGHSYEKQPSSVSEDEDEKQKRRLERNLREQERSHRITEQISELRELLNLAKVRFKPDKYSTLTAVSDYIRTLQKRSIWLEEEHRKLIRTISQTNEMVNSSKLHGFQRAQSTPAAPQGQSQVVPNSNRSQFGNVFDDGFATFCRGLDYKGIFARYDIPTCVTGVDGRILDCNEKFRTLFCITKDQLNQLASPALPQSTECKQISVFNLIENNDMRLVFSSMSEMLKSTDFMANQERRQIKTKKSTDKLAPDDDLHQHTFIKADHWSGLIRQCNHPQKSVSS